MTIEYNELNHLTESCNSYGDSSSKCGIGKPNTSMRNLIIECFTEKEVNQEASQPVLLTVDEISEYIQTKYVYYKTLLNKSWIVSKIDLKERLKMNFRKPLNQHYKKIMFS